MVKVRCLRFWRGLDFWKVFDAVVSSFSMLLLSPDMFREASRRICKAIKCDGLFYLSLNEPSNRSKNPDDEVYVNIMGQDMYSRAYTSKEIGDIFIGLGFNQVSFYRETQFSKEFGEEHVIEFVFKKGM